MTESDFQFTAMDMLFSQMLDECVVDLKTCKNCGGIMDGKKISHTEVNLICKQCGNHQQVKFTGGDGCDCMIFVV